VQPDGRSYTVIIQAMVEAERANEAAALLTAMRAAAFVPSLKLCNKVWHC
jgi:pentatricopeptide repeat protein